VFNRCEKADLERLPFGYNDEETLTCDPLTFPSPTNPALKTTQARAREYWERALGDKEALHVRRENELIKLDKWGSLVALRKKYYNLGVKLLLLSIPGFSNPRHHEPHRKWLRQGCRSGSVWSLNWPKFYPLDDVVHADGVRKLIERAGCRTDDVTGPRHVSPPRRLPRVGDLGRSRRPIA